MLLELENFRCWKKDSFNFPDKGLNLISGESGKGKTSILNAIYFALYGQGKKIISYGEKKCKVRLVFKQLDITRTKNPNHLLLFLKETGKQKDNIYEDDVAQEIINQKLGINFFLTSYITQKTINSFLNLSSSEKMTFLEKLSFSSEEENIDAIKKKIKSHIKTDKDNLLQKVGELQMIEKEFNSMTKPEEKKFPLSGKESGIKIKNEAIYWKRTKKLLEENNKLYIVLQNEYTEEKIKINKKNQLQKNLLEINQKINKLNLQREAEESTVDINKLEKKLKKIIRTKEYNKLKIEYKKEKENYDRLSLEELNNLKVIYDSLMEEYKKYLNIENGLELQQSLKLKISNIEKYVSIIKEIEKQKLRIKSSLKSSVNNLENELDTLIKKKQDLSQRLHIKICPSCKSSLRIVNNQLIKAEGLSDKINPENNEREEDIEKQIKFKKSELDIVKSNITLNEEINKNIFKLEENLKKLNINEDELVSCNVLKQKINNINIIEKEYITLLNQIKEAKDKLEKKILSPTLKKIFSQLEIKKKKINELESEFIKSDKKEDEDSENEDSENEDSESKDSESEDSECEDESSENNLRNKINKLKIKREKFKGLIIQIKTLQIEKNQVENEINNITLSERNYEEEIKNNHLYIKELQDKEKIHQETNKLIQEYLEYKKLSDEYEKWNKRFTDCKKEEEKLKNNLSLSEILFKKIQEAESISIMQSISTINYHMNSYLEKFFPEYPITVEIYPFKETKKDIKYQIEIKVGYKGSDIDITSLSGGEYDRVTLSIVLALNTIFSSSLLMLDESIASLDSELTNDILQVIKENKKETLVIIVAHQINEGIFDNVCNLN